MEATAYRVLPKVWFVEDDGGRAAAGYRGQAGDCVARSIAIAATLPYQTVYDALNVAAKSEPARGRTSSARNGVARPTIRRFMKDLGWNWTPTMHIGGGTTVHLCPEELPLGRLVVSCSKHLTAVIDGVIHDTHDPSRGGTRCVYGYWSKPESARFVAGRTGVQLNAAPQTRIGTDL
ncbi:MAG TPA: hypothetical protein VHZ96_23280 [Frankiaceae bacterium]|jgi:hypothetical protein|nr:hypothetical protein [Frankiaceae bacterium]